jgi:antitoxin MazE
MKAVLRRIGNSRGVVIPKRLLTKAGLEGDVEMTLEHRALVLRKSARLPRAGWAEAAKRIAARDDDRLSMGEFGNEADSTLEW